MKTLEEIKKEYYKKFNSLSCFGVKSYQVANGIDNIWQFIVSTISQTKQEAYQSGVNDQAGQYKEYVEEEKKKAKQEVIEDKRKTEYEILNIFMQFVRNGHNLNKHDLDRIESEWALFEARNYSDLFLEKLSK